MLEAAIGIHLIQKKVRVRESLRVKNLENEKLKCFQLADEGKSKKEREFLPFYTSASVFEF